MAQICEYTRCDQPIAPAPTGRPRRFCSDRCRKAAARAAAKPPTPTGIRRKRSFTTDYDSYERLITKVYLHDPAAAALMLEHAHATGLQIDEDWIEREVERRRDEAAHNERIYNQFLDTVNNGFPVG